MRSGANLKIDILQNNLLFPAENLLCLDVDQHFLWEINRKNYLNEVSPSVPVL